MSEEVKCVEPAGGPVTAPEPASSSGTPREERTMTVPLARVGKAAPDFEASAYQKGGFKNIKLSDYRGQWVILCFYPGDFTFV